jgi:hypothetical protein
MSADAATSHWYSGPAARATVITIAAAVPIVLVNSTAFIGQFAWTRQHVPWIIPGQVLFSVAIESVAIYLAWHAHLAALANDSASRLKLGAYLFALIIGAMNYSHYASHWRPNALAIGLGLMSALSPWLWGIHTRRTSRDKLMERGLVEEHAVRLGANRWLWHAWRSARVMFRATWVGETDPQRAIGAFADRGWGTLVPAEPVRHLPGAPAAVPVAQPDVPAIESVPAAPERASTGAPEQSVPEVSVPAGSPAVPVLVIPDPYTPEHHLTADPVETGPAPTSEAHLSAAPSLSAGNSKRPPQERIDEVKEWLAAIPLDQLPSNRAIARRLDEDSDQRRLGAQLRSARIADEAQRDLESLGAPAQDADPAGAPQLPVQTRQPRPDQAQYIARPASTLPGGGEMSG